MTKILGLLLALLLVPLPAAAQLQAPNRLDAVEHVHRACPGLIYRDHEFTDAVATYLHQQDPRWGRNGKRGNANDPSHDAIAFRNPASPFGVSIVDIIGAAGSSSASPAWIDQTQATITVGTTGVWVRPSGRLPACLTGGSGGGSTPPPPVTEPPPPPAPVVNLGPIVEALARIESRLAALESRPSPSLDLFASYVDDMIGSGPADDPHIVPNHITDLKQRLDALRLELEQQRTWLRGRAVLRY